MADSTAAGLRQEHFPSAVCWAETSEKNNIFWMNATFTVMSTECEPLGQQNKQVKWSGMDLLKGNNPKGSKHHRRLHWGGSLLLAEFSLISSLVAAGIWGSSAPEAVL